jgi:class 3 adenylate cyclase
MTSAFAGNRAGFFVCLRDAGFVTDDSAEVRLQKSLLILATGLVCFASMLWLFFYWQLGPQFPTTIPLLYQALLLGNLVVYFRTCDYRIFSNVQLALFLFMPFVTQWSVGNFISASGVSLWALLAPIGAILCIGAREALAWFFAYLVLTAFSGAVDYYLGDVMAAHVKVSTHTAVFFFALNFAAISAIVFLLLRFSATEKQKIEARLREAHAQLRIEQERSEQLLLNILPGPIAERLKNSRQPIADGFADVSVMFVDIVNFTRVAEKLNPQQVFAMLNRIFSSFDELAEKFGLEKIKTIGDAYMVAGGLTDTRSDYTEALADLALVMRDLLRRDLEVNAYELEVRIGIGTGPVVAGVVGTKKFIYDLWGDTVNLASRITGEGAPGMIQVDTATFAKLRESFDFMAPQSIYLKGKGRTIVHRVVGRKARAEAIALPMMQDNVISSA